jgi:hypothetical protein
MLCAQASVISAPRSGSSSRENDKVSCRFSVCAAHLEGLHASVKRPIPAANSAKRSRWTMRNRPVTCTSRSIRLPSDALAAIRSVRTADLGPQRDSESVKSSPNSCDATRPRKSGPLRMIAGMRNSRAMSSNSSPENSRICTEARLTPALPVAKSTFRFMWIVAHGGVDDGSYHRPATC